MKFHLCIPGVLLIASVFSGCKAPGHPSAPPPVAATGSSDGKAVVADDLDEYAAASVADPIEPLNRATFVLNDGIYRFLFRPISKVYRTIVPKLIRTGIGNAYENVKFPIRFVNNTLQGNLPRAGQETGMFVVNSTLGIGGLMRPSEKFPLLANVPPADTGQTFAKWGIGPGFYLVLPVLGPSTARDAVGLAGDYALNPVSWVTIVYGGYVWTMAIPTVNTLRALPSQMDQYEAATDASIDDYLAVRSFFIQYRNEISKK